MKYDTSGNVTWAKSAGGTSNGSLGNSVATDATGNIYVTGYFGSPTVTFGTTTLTNAGIGNIFIVKYDSNGNVIWAKSAGGIASDYANSVATDATGNIYITGFFSSSSITFGTTTLTNAGNTDIFIAKYDINGNVICAKSAGGASNDQGNSVATDANGSTYITGRFASPSITFRTTTLTNLGTYDVFIAKLSVISTSYVNTNVNCYGGNSGSATVSATGGNLPYTYQWMPSGGNGGTANNLSAGTYTVTITDAIGNTDTANIIITQPASLPSFTYSQINSCLGSNTGSITITATGGTGTFQYSKNGGSTYQFSNFFTGLASGTYQIVVKDSNNCTAPSQSVTITQPTSLPSFTYAQINPCFGGTNGSIIITANGGAGTYHYSINGGSTYQASNVFSGLSAGTYQIMVKDANNCITSTQAAIITQPLAISTSLTHVNVNCYGGNTGSITVTASGGTGAFTFNWLPYGGTGSTANNLTTGTYTVTVTDSNSCTTSANVTITQPSSALTIYNTSVVNTQCGTPTGQITANVSGGALPYHYMWSNGDTTSVIQNLGAGNYTLTFTDGNGCNTTSPILTVGTTLPNFGVNFTAIATTGAAPFFAGFTNATPNMSSYNFTWFWGDATSTASNNTNVTHTYAFGGFYDVSLVAVNITNGCADTLKKTGYIFVTGTGCTQTSVVSPSAPFTGCTGDTLILTASTNATTYTYQWNVNGTLISGATGNTLAVTQTGMYSVTSIEAGCPVTSSVVSVSMSTNPPTPVITATGTIVPCVGGSVALTASPINGGSYLWNTNATSQSITVTTPGAYTVTENYGTSLCSSTSAPFYLGTSLPIVPVCMVSVDSLSTHNVVVWEKTNVGAEVDSFRVYRETMTNVYSNIASVSNDSLSEYHDYGANPNVTSYKYKLVAIDTCGSISGMSDFHNSIHLQYLGNGNLQWTLYDIENAGNPVNFYIINRDDTGTGNFLPISSTIPGGNNTYTDINYANYPNARYRADVTWSIVCNPTRSGSTTRSNIIHLGPNSISQVSKGDFVSISPNPFNAQLTISFGEEQKNTTIKVMNMLGECIQQQTTNKQQLTMDLSGFANGVYFVRIQDEHNNIVNRKVVKQ